MAFQKMRAEPPVAITGATSDTDPSTQGSDPLDFYNLDMKERLCIWREQPDQVWTAHLAWLEQEKVRMGIVKQNAETAKES